MVEYITRIFDTKPFSTTDDDSMVEAAIKARVRLEYCATAVRRVKVLVTLFWTNDAAVIMTKTSRLDFPVDDIERITKAWKHNVEIERSAFDESEITAVTVKQRRSLMGK